MRPNIVVGLNENAGWYALAWATDEAVVTGARLVLCHACPPDSPLARTTVTTARLELFDPPLSRAVGTARTRLGGDRVTLRVRVGSPEQVLVAAADADLVVVGSPTTSAPGGLGSTTHHVAAHAPCPVVVVRPAAGVRDAPFAGHVVVGVKDSVAARAALEFGFGYAQAHRLPLAAVHVDPRRHGDLRFDGVPPQTHPPDGSPDVALLATEVEPWTRKYPDVPTKAAGYGGRPLPALLRAATGARLLVVGDHGHGPAVRALLGTVSDGAVDRADCPVAVVHGWERRGGDTP